jgi:hypothetical protein|tara:strand:- start:6182 stop:6430 length:249 start_codon:yes stop_codon:yes gene_type:complete
MDLKQLLNSITPDIYLRLKLGVEIGKWPDGNSLTREQKELCMQAIIAYEQALPEDQRTGYVPPKKTPCAPDTNEPQPLSWKN